LPATCRRDRLLLLRYSNREVLLALGLAGTVNMAMVAMAAVVFHHGHAGVADISVAYHTLVPLLGGGAALVFALSLLASGASSSLVGTMAGQVIMQDFVHFRMPLWLRRAITMAPAFVIIGLGADVTRSLVWSQVVLSLALPVPMVALVLLTGDRRLMGPFVNSHGTQAVAIAATLVVLGLNLLLVLQACGVGLPGLA
jgi:manganese transport protein